MPPALPSPGRRRRFPSCPPVRLLVDATHPPCMRRREGVLMPSLCPLAVVKFFVLQAAQGQVCLDDKWAGSNASVAVANLNEASNLVSNLGAVASGMTKRYACGAGPNWRASAHEGHSDKVHSPTLRSPSTPHPTSNTRPLTPNLLTPSILGRRAPSSCGSSRQLASCWRPACRLPKHAARSTAVATSSHAGTCARKQP